MTPELKDKLRRLVYTMRAAHKAVVAETNEVRASGEMEALVRHFNELRDMQELLKEVKKGWDGLHDFLSKEAIPDIFNEYRQKTRMAPPYRIDGVGTVNVSYKWTAGILEQKKEEGKEWLRTNGFGALIIETVPAPSLSALAKDLYENNGGKELPEDIFKSGRNPYTSIIGRVSENEG
jgi:hypothetical protein